MPSSETKEDPRVTELSAVNQRLKTVLAFLKTRHTSDSLDAMLETAEAGVGDMTPAFVRVDGATAVQGTRHMESLLRMTEVMEIRLLERKVELLRSLSAKPAAGSSKRTRA